MIWEQELTQVLKKEEELLSGLAECAERKTDLLAHGKVEEIGALLEREQPLSLELQGQEAVRLELLRQNGFEGLTMRAVASRAQEAFRPLLEAQRSALFELATRVRERNLHNLELTRSRVELYGKLRSQFTVPVYGRSGSPAQDGAAGLYNRRV